ncbi:hypothetical protein P9D43_27885 [Neobacillus niacini]|uniref:hypothetical protein n=1 Tax=Neobacillus niacini TaxID=86668 RepID=UPI0007ABD9EE|nr:hypothetical protein [Neobacillus niacini]MEC1525825.1 hypothetical protein [Neobacillus niacini]
MQGELKVFHDTFHKSTISDFRSFIDPFNKIGVTKWMIYSDYCFDDEKKLYNAATFTILPYIDDIVELKEIINKMAPVDLKRASSVDERFCAFMKSGYMFNISIVFEKGKNHYFGISSKEQYLQDLDKIIKQFELWIVTTPTNEVYFNSVIKKVKKLKQEMERKTFSMKLFQNINMIQAIVSYLMLIISKESIIKPDLIGWFSDRDKLITSYGGILYDLLQMNYHNMCDAEKITDKECRKIAVAEPDLKVKSLWYDEMVRMPDYLSGALAGRNFINPNRDKYDELFEMAIVDNPYLAVMSFVIEDQKKFIRRLTFSKTTLDLKK